MLNLVRRDQKLVVDYSPDLGGKLAEEQRFALVGFVSELIGD